jgi:hypothetical protein
MHITPFSIQTANISRPYYRSVVITAVIALVLEAGILFRAAADTPSIPIRYNLAKPSDVSINIYDSNGHVVRELLHGAKRSTGKIRRNGMLSTKPESPSPQVHIHGRCLRPRGCTVIT